MIYEVLGGMFECDFADMCAKKSTYVDWGSSDCVKREQTWEARTSIGVGGYILQCPLYKKTIKKTFKLQKLAKQYLNTHI